MTDRWGPYPGPAAPQAHLEDAELVAVHRSAASDKHLVDCGLCRARLADAQPADDAFETLLAELATSDGTSSFAHSGSTLPTRLVSYLQPSAAIPDAIEAGQLWRLAWRGRQQLAVILQRDALWVDVAPVTIDSSLADEYTLLLPASATCLSQPAAVFTRSRGTVPLLVLDHYLGTVGVGAETGEFISALTSLMASHRSSRSPGPLPADVATGRPLQVHDWDRQSYLDALDEDVAWFASAASEVVDDGGNVRAKGAGMAAELGPDPAVDVAEELHRRRNELSELVKLTGLDPRRLLQLATRQAVPTRGEQLLFARALGLTVSTGRSSLEQQVALAELAHPRFRARRESWTRQHASGAAADDIRPALEALLSEKAAARSTAAAPASLDEALRSEYRDRISHLLDDGE